MSDITVVTTISPIPSHPDIAILSETVESVRHHLPDSHYILSFDGIRPEHQHLTSAYHEATRRTLWTADHHWGNTTPHIWTDHLHQIGQLRNIINDIHTPLILFVEHDTPLELDTINWQAAAAMIHTGKADIIRYHHESSIPDEHQHMMLGTQGHYTRTCQYSARPHLASTAYYRRVLTDHFSPNANCHIEDVLHGTCHNAWLEYGETGWNQHKIWIYTPAGNIRRSYHLDGRAGTDKLDETQVF